MLQKKALKATVYEDTLSGRFWTGVANPCEDCEFPINLHGVDMQNFSRFFLGLLERQPRQLMIRDGILIKGEWCLHRTLKSDWCIMGNEEDCSWILAENERLHGNRASMSCFIEPAYGLVTENDHWPAQVTQGHVQLILRSTQWAKAGSRVARHYPSNVRSTPYMHVNYLFSGAVRLFAS